MSSQLAQAQISIRELRLPNFLIIGAMKAGTTTLYEDLSRHPDIFMPDVKEPHSLRNDDVFQKKHLQAYTRLFASAAPSQVCGEASTTYTNRPTFEGVADRARRLLGDHVKLIYIVRDPVQRTLSHHRFHYQFGNAAAEINQAIRQQRTLVDYSRYAMQLGPWLDVFGRESLHVVMFEDYIRDRHGGINAVCDFLGIPHLSNPIENTVIYNRTTDVRALRGFWRRIAVSSIYSNGIRPLITGPIGKSRLSWLRRRLAQGPLPDPPQTTMETKREIADAVRDDARRFSELTGVDISSWESLRI